MRPSRSRWADRSPWVPSYTSCIGSRSSSRSGRQPWPCRPRRPPCARTSSWLHRTCRLCTRRRRCNRGARRRPRSTSRRRRSGPCAHRRTRCTSRPDTGPRACTCSRHTCRTGTRTRDRTGRRLRRCTPNHPARSDSPPRHTCRPCTKCRRRSRSSRSGRRRRRPRSRPSDRPCASRDDRSCS